MPFKDQLFLASQYLAPHHLVSRLMGRVADCRAPEIKNRMIARFVRRYNVDMSEALVEDPLAYASFNDFFTRALKPDARPLDDEPGAALCPA
ncbi:phosphatidylserine decarboxylase, partial [Bordetella pertussis]